jgi:hypothetical protein
MDIAIDPRVPARTRINASFADRCLRDRLALIASPDGAASPGLAVFLTPIGRARSERGVRPRGCLHRSKVAPLRGCTNDAKASMACHEVVAMGETAGAYCKAIATLKQHLPMSTLERLARGPIECLGRSPIVITRSRPFCMRMAFSCLLGGRYATATKSRLCRARTGRGRQREVDSEQGSLHRPQVAQTVHCGVN